MGKSRKEKRTTALKDKKDKKDKKRDKKDDKDKYEKQDKKSVKKDKKEKKGKKDKEKQRKSGKSVNKYGSDRHDDSQSESGSPEKELCGGTDDDAANAFGDLKIPSQGTAGIEDDCSDDSTVAPEQDDDGISIAPSSVGDEDQDVSVEADGSTLVLKTCKLCGHSSNERNPCRKSSRYQNIKFWPWAHGTERNQGDNCANFVPFRTNLVVL